MTLRKIAKLIESKANLSESTSNSAHSSSCSHKHYTHLLSLSISFSHLCLFCIHTQRHPFTHTHPHHVLHLSGPSPSLPHIHLGTHTAVHMCTHTYMGTLHWVSLLVIGNDYSMILKSHRNPQTVLSLPHTSLPPPLLSFSSCLPESNHITQLLASQTGMDNTGF